MLVDEMEETLLHAYGWDQCLICKGYGFLLEEAEEVNLPQGYRNVQNVRICGECCGTGRSLD